MKKVLHISSECYPAAKAGGMGDVVGALPMYMPEQGIEASVVIPKYDNEWFASKTFSKVKKGKFKLGDKSVSYQVLKLKGDDLPFPFYCIDLPELFDRKSIYLDKNGHGYKDEPERNIAFQRAVLEWLSSNRSKFDVLHCHDHMTALITFFIKNCPRFKKLKETPTLLTIHNGQYRGIFEWNRVQHLLPKFDASLNGWLDWDGVINSLATGIKCAWSVNTVSPSYMEELKANSDTLTHLYDYEGHKCRGIINGIDAQEWDPNFDKYLNVHLEKKGWAKFKSGNKELLSKEYGLSSNKPLVGYIGRMADQKGADILAGAIREKLEKKKDVNFIILGSGDKYIEQELVELANQYKANVTSIIAYDEHLARRIYAGTDYLIMPSRFEPCGLNQMYAMRYGSIPIVTAVGGLKDTVPDISANGNGIVINRPKIADVEHALTRSVILYKNKKKFKELRKKITELDFSWSNSAYKYAQLYYSLLNIKQ